MAKAPRAKAAEPRQSDQPRAGAGRKGAGCGAAAMEADGPEWLRRRKRVLAAQVKARGSARKTDKNAGRCAAALQGQARFAGLEEARYGAGSSAGGEGQGQGDGRGHHRAGSLLPIRRRRPSWPSASRRLSPSSVLRRLRNLRGSRNAVPLLEQRPRRAGCVPSKKALPRSLWLRSPQLRSPRRRRLRPARLRQRRPARRPSKGLVALAAMRFRKNPGG